MNVDGTESKDKFEFAPTDARRRRSPGVDRRWICPTSSYFGNTTLMHFDRTTSQAPQIVMKVNIGMVRQERHGDG